MDLPAFVRESSTGYLIRECLSDTPDFDACREYIRCGANVHYTDKDSHTILFYVIKNKPNPDVVRFLIEAGTSFTAKNKINEIPVLYAVRNSQDSIVKVLIDAGVNIERQDTFHGFTLLMEAIYTPQTPARQNIITMLLDAGANVNVCVGTTSHTYPLQQAYGMRDTRTFEELILAGADVDIALPTKWTLIHSASLISSSIKYLKRLIECGANVNCVNKWGNTPLWNVIHWGRIDQMCVSAVQMLLDAGADPLLSGEGHLPSIIHASDNVYQEPSVHSSKILEMLTRVCVPEL